MDQKIIDYITNHLRQGLVAVTISPEDDLLSSGLIESMSMMRLIHFIEQEFELKIPPQDMTIEHFISVAAMVKYIEKVKATA